MSPKAHPLLSENQREVWENMRGLYAPNESEENDKAQGSASPPAEVCVHMYTRQVQFMDKAIY